MKRAERHHLKENELLNLAVSTRQVLTGRSRPVLTAAVAIALVGAVVLGYFAWRGRADAQANTMLGEALTIEDTPVGPPPAPPAGGAAPPAPVSVTFATDREKYEAARAKYKTVADQYPSTDAGVFARYREGAVLMMLGNTKEAVAAYEEAVNRGGTSLYGEMARLGLADALARSGEYDRAIETYKSFTDGADGELPVDGILMQLGRTYREAGKTTEARQTFTRLVDEFPTSSFSADARRELEALNSQM
jgi:tetratricopeptide (TPR) repeat protein